MEYGMPFSSSVDDYSSGYNLRRTKSIELRAGKLYKTCDCIKRNGLQQDCRRSECQGRFCCMSGNPSCNPSQSARRMANHTMGLGARNYYSGSSRYQDTMSMSNMQNMSRMSRHYGMGDVGGDQIIDTSDPGMMAYCNGNSFEGAPSEPANQFLASPQAPSYGDCQPTGERARYGEYSSYGPMNVGPSDEHQYSGYGQG